MKRLIIIGAGGFGKEVLSCALAIPKEKRDWEVHGFIDDDPNALNNYDTPYRVVGSIKDHIVKDDEVFICSIGDPKTKLRICRKLKEQGAEFISLVHPRASVGSSSTYGQGLIMLQYSIIGENVRLGEFVTVNVFSIFSHDSTAEDGCTLSAYCDMTGFTYLEEGVFAGSHATVIPGLRVGRYAKIGAGSVVIKKVKENATVFGNPAKVIK